MENLNPTFLEQVPAAFYWACAIIIIILFFLVFFGKSIRKLIERTKEVKVGKGGAEFLQQQKEPVQEILTDENDEKDQELPIIRGLQIFDEQTIRTYRDEVIKATNLEKRKDDKDKIEILIQYSEALLILLMFERYFYLIFGSQLMLLQHLNSEGYRPKNEFKFYFDNAVKKNPDFFKNFDYEQYLSFLINNDLITEDNNNISITILGRDFLKFIVHNGLSDYKAF